MPLTDLLHALPGVLVFGLVPGLLLAMALAPRWSAWLRLAAAPGLSAGLLGVLGLLAHDLHVAFRPWWVGIVMLALLGAAVVRTMRVRSQAQAQAPAQAPAVHSRHAARALLAANAPQLLALACGLVAVGTIAAALHDEPLPLDSDPAVHAAVAERIAAGGDILPVIPNPVDHSASVRPRAGAEAVAAFAASLGAPSPTAALLPAALLAVVLAPLGVCLLALELTGSRAIAALAPVLAAGSPYPALPVAFGELPLIVDSTLVIPLAIAALRVVRALDGRQNAAMVVAIVASIWAVHGTEVITAAVIAVPMALLLLTRGTGLGARLEPRAWLRGVAVALLAVAAGALLVTVTTRLPQVPGPVPAAGTGPEVPEPSTVGGGSSLANFPREFFDFVLPVRAWLAIYVVGLIAAWKRTALRGLIAAHLVLAAILADVVTHRVLLKLYEKVFPWSEPDRLASDQYWVLPVILAAGLVFAANLLAPALRTRLRTAPSAATAPRVAVATIAVAAAVVVAVGRDHDAHFYADARADVGVVSGSDLTVMHAMAAQLPPGTAVMADGIDDAGQWAIALTPDPVFMSKDYVISHPQDTRLVAIANACVDPAAARQALSGAGAVFVGARERGVTRHHWQVSCIAKIPGVRLIAQSGASAAFAVEP